MVAQRRAYDAVLIIVIVRFCLSCLKNRCFSCSRRKIELWAHKLLDGQGGKHQNTTALLAYTKWHFVRTKCYYTILIPSCNWEVLSSISILSAIYYWRADSCKHSKIGDNFHRNTDNVHSQAENRHVKTKMRSSKKSVGRAWQQNECPPQDGLPCLRL